VRRYGQLKGKQNGMGQLRLIKLRKSQAARRQEPSHLDPLDGGWKFEAV